MPNPNVDLIVEIGQPQAGAAGQAARPQVDLIYSLELPVIGQDVYVVMYNPGPGHLLSNAIQLKT